MEPTCSAADLAHLAEMCRAEGLAAKVEEETLRVSLPGSCYARPDAGGGVLGWTGSSEVLWYGRFDSVSDLVRSVRSVRHLRRLARMGFGLIGVWLAHVAAMAAVPWYVTLTRDADLLHGLLFLCALLGAGAWLAARILRWRLRRIGRGVVWLRGPLEQTQRVPR